MAGVSYGGRYARLCANIVAPDNEQACWLWAGNVSHNGYPQMTVRIPGKPHPVALRAHRVMLEEVLGAEFPFDEAGHLCYAAACINPDHLEVQAPAFNLADRRGYAARETDARMIPVLFPRTDALQEAADLGWDGAGLLATVCPF